MNSNGHTTPYVAYYVELKQQRSLIFNLACEKHMLFLVKSNTVIWQCLLYAYSYWQLISRLRYRVTPKASVMVSRAQVSQSPDVVGMQNENQLNIFLLSIDLTLISLKRLIRIWFYNIKQKSAKMLTDLGTLTRKAGEIVFEYIFFLLDVDRDNQLFRRYWCYQTTLYNVWLFLHVILWTAVVIPNGDATGRGLLELWCTRHIHAEALHAKALLCHVNSVVVLFISKSTLWYSMVHIQLRGARVLRLVSVNKFFQLWQQIQNFIEKAISNQGHLNTVWNSIHPNLPHPTPPHITHY